MADTVNHGNGDALRQMLIVAQATGMVSVQAGCSMEYAVELMEGHAKRSSVTLEEIAKAVINRNIKFD